MYRRLLRVTCFPNSFHQILIHTAFLPILRVTLLPGCEPVKLLLWKPGWLTALPTAIWGFGCGKSVESGRHHSSICAPASMLYYCCLLFCPPQAALVCPFKSSLYCTFSGVSGGTEIRCMCSNTLTQNPSIFCKCISLERGTVYSLIFNPSCFWRNAFKAINFPLNIYPTDFDSTSTVIGFQSFCPFHCDFYMSTSYLGKYF